MEPSGVTAATVPDRTNFPWRRITTYCPQSTLPVGLQVNVHGFLSLRYLCKGAVGGRLYVAIV